MKILYLVEFVRENYFSTDKYGKPQLDFKSSEAYLELEKILKEKNIDLKSVDFDYAYPRVPEPKKLDRNNNIISYEDVKISEIKEYLPELEDKIANNKYDLVIVTGKNGLKAFSKSGSSITKLRGIPEKIEVKGHETWLLPMYSIEYVWARLNNARFLSLDLDMVKEFTKQGQEYFEPVKTEYLNLTNIEQVHAVFDYIKKEKPLVAWDLETNTRQPDNKGAKVIMISLSWADKQGITIPLYKKETPFSEEECEVILQRMAEFLADPNIWKVGHNCRFDIHFLMSAHNIKDFVNTLDTKVGYYLTISQENNVSFKLSDLAYEFTDMGGYDDELENYKKEYIKSYAKENKKDPLNEVDGTKFNYDWIPMDIIAYYAAGDADCTRRICKSIMNKINQREQWKNLFYVQYPRLITTLAQIQSNGMYVDKETFKEVQEAYDKQVEILQEELRQFPAVKEMERENRQLYQLGIEEFKKPVAERNKDIVKYRDKFRKAGTNFNPNSNLEKAKVLYHFTDVKLKKKDSKIFLKDSFANKKLAWEDTDYTMYKTDKFAVGELAKGDYGEDVAELAEKMLEYSSISTLRGNYINKYPNYISNVDNCIHGTFNETGTACISGYSLITTTKGLIPIKDLSDNRNVDTFSEIEDIYTPTQEGIKQAPYFYYSGYAKPVRLTFDDGTEHKTSINHRLVCREGKEDIWKYSENIKVGDYIKSSFNNNLYGNLEDLDFEINRYFMEWLGIFSTLGGYGDNLYIDLANNNKPVKEYIEQITQKALNKAKLSIQDNKLIIKEVNPTILKYLTRPLDLDNKLITFLLQTTKEKQQQFIKGSMIDYKLDTNNISLQAFNLIVDIVKPMLDNMGIYSVIDRYNRRIDIIDVVKFLNNIGLINNKEIIIKDKGKPYKTIDGIIYKKVINVELMNEEIELYDLNVPSNHQYTANGLINHNTSRLSSSNPNIQQISTTSSDVKKFDYKYPVKRIFKSRFKNGIILNADYSALEIRILGLAARDEVMTDSFFKGEDAHKNTASIVFEKPISEVTADERQASKAISFGLIYGKENYTMAQDLEISNEEADEMVNRYFSNKPAVRDFIENTKKGLEKNGYVETLQGHRRLLNEVFGDKISYNDAMRQSVNTVIQGTGAFLTNTSIVYINEMLKNMKSKLIATVHDSVLLDVHPDEIYEVAPKVKYIMENLPIPFLQIEWEGKLVQYPITSDIEIGESYEDVFEYNKEEFSKFKTVHGFTEYKKAEKYIIDSFECNYITEEEKDKKLKELEANVESYYKL